MGLLHVSSKAMLILGGLERLVDLHEDVSSRFNVIFDLKGIFPTPKDKNGRIFPENLGRFERQNGTKN
jgi:hypothetical protein